MPTITDIVDVDYPNPSPVSYGAFTNVLGQFARDRQYMTQEEAIRKMTYTHRAPQLPSGRGWESLEALVS